MTDFEKEQISKVSEKAAILVDALPYIRDFADKIVVICYCCSNLLSAREEQAVMKDVSLLKSIGMKPIVVHDTRFGADRYRENKRIAKLIEMSGNKAVGICGIDLKTLRLTVDNGYIPVVTPNDIDTEDMILYPENVASEIAQRMGAEKLVYMSEDRGLFEDGDENGKLLSMVTRSQVIDYIVKYKLSKQFLLRLRNAVSAVDHGVGRVHILDGCVDHGLLLEFFSIDGIGTAVMADEGRYYSHENT